MILKRSDVDSHGVLRFPKRKATIEGTGVRDLQKKLYAAGYLEGVEEDVVDGVFGKGTQNAVRDFQMSRGIERDTFNTESDANSLEEAVATKNDIVNGTPYFISGIPHYFQADPVWKDCVLGRNKSLKQAGCALCCCAMTASFYLGREVRPDELDAFLDENGGYSGDNIVWDVVRTYLLNHGTRVSYDRIDGNSKNSNIVQTAKDLIDQGTPPLLRVDYGKDANSKYNHFVLGIGYVTTENDPLLVFHDPGSKSGDGYVKENRLANSMKTKRQGGYHLVQVDWYEIRAATV